MRFKLTVQMGRSACNQIPAEVRIDNMQGETQVRAFIEKPRKKTLCLRFAHVVMCNEYGMRIHGMEELRSDGNIIKYLEQIWVLSDVNQL